MVMLYLPSCNTSTPLGTMTSLSKMESESYWWALAIFGSAKLIMTTSPKRTTSKVIDLFEANKWLSVCLWLARTGGFSQCYLRQERNSHRWWHSLVHPAILVWHGGHRNSDPRWFWAAVVGSGRLLGQQSTIWFTFREFSHWW